MAKIVRPTNNEILNKEKTSYYKSKNSKTCIYCGVSFSYGQSNNSSCGLCLLKYNCPECGKLVIKVINGSMSGQSKKILYQHIKDNSLNTYRAFCSNKCSINSRTKPGECTSCGSFSDKRTGTGLCLRCCKKYSSISINKNKASGNCVKCGKFFNSRTTAGLCFECQKFISIKNIENNKGAGICSICNKFKKERHLNICIDCKSKLGSKILLEQIKPGICSTCGKYSNKRTLGMICQNCRNKMYIQQGRNTAINNSKAGKCIKCEKYSEVRNSFGLCLNCIGYWNEEERNKFYSQNINLISYKNENETISYNMINKYNKIPGVWSVWGFKDNRNICLNVCQTIDIGKEISENIRGWHRRKGLSDEDIENSCKNRQYKESIIRRFKKQRNIIDFSNTLNIIIVAKNINNKKKRENIEAQYAHDNKAMFWNPAPGQKLF